MFLWSKYGHSLISGKFVWTCIHVIQETKGTENEINVVSIRDNCEYFLLILFII